MKKGFPLAAYILVFCFLSVALTGCEDEEANKLNVAQGCLDDVTGDGSGAEACRVHIEGLTSQRSYIVLCSIEMMVGGLTTTKIVSALDKLSETGTADKEAQMIQLLSLNSIDQATVAFNACNQSGMEGLIYIAGLARIGTVIYDSSNVLSDCVADPSSCSPSDIGDTAIAISETYCALSNAESESEICNSINLAVDEGGADSAAIGAALFEALNAP